MHCNPVTNAKDWERLKIENNCTKVVVFLSTRKFLHRKRFISFLLTSFLCFLKQISRSLLVSVLEKKEIVIFLYRKSYSIKNLGSFDSNCQRDYGGMFVHINRLALTSMLNLI